MVGALISIDAYKQAEAALRDADRRKDEFLAMLAHELRNPLAPIHTAGEVLRMVNSDPARVRAAAEIIDRQVRHLTKLLDDLLDVSRVTRGLVTLEKEHVDMVAVIHTAIEQAAPLLQGKDHSLETKLEGRAHVMGDRARLVQIVANLLSNAARYTPARGRIELTLRRRGDEVEVSVADNGSGIEPEFLPRIFELFTQGERSPDRSQGGLGLGLALVKRLAELHGGKARASSPGQGQGAVFTVSIPAAPEEVASNNSPTAVRTQEPRHLRIMVVDDNHDAADSISNLLGAVGHSVDVRYDADSVLDAADLGHYDTFVIDIGLPGRDGHALARALRDRGVRARLIALTGYGQPADRERSLASGFDEHLVKPVEWPALEAALGRG